MFIVKGSIGNDLILVIRPKLRTFDPPNLLYVGVFEEVTGVGQKHVFFDYLNVGLIHSSSHIHRETCCFGYLNLFHLHVRFLVLWFQIMMKYLKF